MSPIFQTLDWIFFCLLALPVVYLLVFAFFSMRRREYTFPETDNRLRFAILVPAYREDRVIEQSVRSALAQDYPREAFEVVVIADNFEPETLARLGALPIRLLDVRFTDSSKAKALGYAMETLGPGAFDVAVILDADNTVGPRFLHTLNNAFDSGAQAVQAHRKAKNLDTDTAVLDAVSEEINNSVFRKGHVALGISSALIGSGMAFEYEWFRNHAGGLSTAGEDKELEVMLLKEGIFIEYLDELEVFDEKARKGKAFYNQRRRWLAAQFYSLAGSLRDLPGALANGNIDYCDKLLQWTMPPRIVLAGILPLVGTALLAVAPYASVKWWAMWLLLLLALSFAIPDYLVNERFKKALRRIPVLFVLMALNLFRLRGARNKFIHTSHGDEQNG